MGEHENWLTPAQLDAWVGFMTTANLLQRLIDLQLAEAGITQVQYELLHHLSDAPDGLSMTQLADASVTTRSGLSYQIDRLEGRELVVRQPGSDDQRMVLVHLTAIGRKVLATTAPGHVAVVRGGLLDQLSDEEVDVLGQLMARTSAHLRSIPLRRPRRSGSEPEC